MCLEAVSNYAWSIKYIPKDMITPEICFKAIKVDGNLLKYVPEPLMTKEMCFKAAVKEGDWMFRNVPKKMVTGVMKMTDGMTFEEMKKNANECEKQSIKGGCREGFFEF